MDSKTNLANHNINDDYDEDFSMLDTINASERSQSKDGYDDNKLGETDQCIGDYTRRHSLPSGYNLRPHVSSRSNVPRNDNKNDSNDESIDRGEPSGCVDNDYGADESALLPSGACPIFKKTVQV